MTWSGSSPFATRAAAGESTHCAGEISGESLLISLTLAAASALV